MDSNMMLISIFAGAFGGGYLIYGIKQQAFVALGSGIILSVYPYFVPNVFLSILIGLFFILLPWFWRV
ncbi:MAG: hypothetical protein WCK88_01080 [bacterium]